jgi:hypothetical protein
MERSYQALQDNPTVAYEEVSLLPPHERERVVLELMRVAPKEAAPLCKLLFTGVGKSRCLRMAAEPHQDWLKLSPQKEQSCTEHPDRDTCWDIRSQKAASMGDKATAVESCLHLLDSHWQAECLRARAVERAQQDKISEISYYCPRSSKLTELNCNEAAVAALISLSIQEHQGLDQDQRLLPSSSQRTWKNEIQRAKRIKMLWKADAAHALYLASSYWSGVIWGLAELDPLFLLNLPQEAASHRRCWSASKRVAQSSQPLADMARWEKDLWVILPENQKRGFPRPQNEIKKSYSTDLLSDESMLQIGVFRAFELRPSSPDDPITDWMLCIMEGIARLQEPEATLFNEILEHPNPILRARAEELHQQIWNEQKD